MCKIFGTNLLSKQFNGWRTCNGIHEGDGNTNWLQCIQSSPYLHLKFVHSLCPLALHLVQLIAHFIEHLRIRRGREREEHLHLFIDGIWCIINIHQVFWWFASLCISFVAKLTKYLKFIHLNIRIKLFTGREIYKCVYNIRECCFCCCFGGELQFAVLPFHSHVALWGSSLS